MAIYRNKTQQFTIVAQSITRDERLSLKDLGLLVKLLSLPDQWEFSENGLIAIFKQDGQTSIRTGLKNLEKFGYLKRTRLRTQDGKLGQVEWSVFAEPINVENPHLENQSVENPNMENRPQYNTNISNNKEDSTKEKKKERKAASTYDELVNNYTNNDELKTALYDFIKMRKFIKSPLTDRALKNIIMKLDSLAQTDQEKIEILEQSITNTWKGVFPLKDKKPIKKYEQEASVEDVIANW